MVETLNRYVASSTSSPVTYVFSFIFESA